MDERTLKKLEEAGWSEEYQVDTSRYEEYLQKNGYPIFPVALDFLKKFGEIKISTRRPGSFCFRADPIHAARLNDHWFFAGFEEVLGRSLCPIAETSNGSITIYVDEEGRVYAGDEGVFYYLTDNPVDMIRIVCSPTQKEFVKLFVL